MTSNLLTGKESEVFGNQDADNAQISEATRQKLVNQLTQPRLSTNGTPIPGLRPEFVNRIDDIIMFHALTRSEIEQIVRIHVATIARRLEEQGITLRVNNDAISFLAEEGFDPDFGARPVKRALQQHLLNDLSRAILGGQVSSAQPILVEKQGESLVFKNDTPA